jgi:hypothetical protein
MTACGASPVSEAAARDRGRDVDRTHRRSPSDSRSTVALSRDRAAGLPEASAENPAAHVRSALPPAQVVPLDRLRHLSRSFDGQVHVVVDASDHMIAVRDLARLAVLRRRIKACGGDLIVVAGVETTRLLRRYRLEQAVPCRDGVAAAIGALDSPRTRTV